MDDATIFATGVVAVDHSAPTTINVGGQLFALGNWRDEQLFHVMRPWEGWDGQPKGSTRMRRSKTWRRQRRFWQSGAGKTVALIGVMGEWLWNKECKCWVEPWTPWCDRGNTVAHDCEHDNKCCVMHAEGRRSTASTRQATAALEDQD